MAKKKKINQSQYGGKILGRVDEKGNKIAFIQNPTDEEDIAPVKQTNNTWFKKGTLDDSGYAIENPIDAINRINAGILMTGVDALGQFGRGFLGSAEGVTDIAKTTTADVLDFFGADNKARKLRESAERTWGVNEQLDQALASDNGTGIDDMSFLGEKGKTVPQGLGTTMFSMTTGGLGGALLGTTAGASATSMALLGMSAAGNSEQEAIKEMKANQKINGLSDKEIYKNAKLYGVLSGIIETGTEMMFGAAAKGSKLLGIGTGAFDEADDAVINALTKKISNKMIKTFAQAGLKATSEGIEEVASGFFNAWAKKITYMKQEDIKKLIEDENLLDSFLSGTFSAALSQAPGVAKHITTVDENGKLRLKSNNEIKDYITDLSTNEQKIADKVAESRFTEEMTNKEKSKIRKEVMDQLRNLELTSDEINKSLGDEVIQGEPADTLLHQIIQNENTKFNFDEAELQVDNKRVNKNATNVEAKIQQLANDFTNELNDIRNTTSAHKLFNEMKNVIQATGEQVRLTSYNELEKQGAVKLLTDEKGNPIRNKNGRLQYTDEKGNLIGINGFRSKDGIVLNSDSTRLFEATMGHEIGESIKANSQNDYKVLREIATELGKLDGTLTDETMKAIERTYGTLGERTDSYLDEYVNDKLGELFTKDSDLINRIGQKPTILRKIIDEVKYLVKRFTTKSEEGKKLLELQHNLENKLQESIRELNVNNKTQEGTQYQLDNQDEKYQSILTNKKEMNLGSYQEGLSKTDKSYRYNKVNSYDIKNGGRGDNVQVAVTKNGYIANNALLSDNIKGKGEGTKIMLDLNQQSLEETGYPLRSLPEYNIVGIKNHTAEGKGLWDSLVRKGFAVKNNDNTYTMLETAPTVEEYVKQRESNTKYSLTQDSQGRELSKEQQEYFKNSKVRDKDGRLIEVYHGTPNSGFTIYDSNRLGETSGADDTYLGFHLTDNIELASFFSGIVNDDVYNQAKQQVEAKYDINEDSVVPFQEMAQINQEIRETAEQMAKEQGEVKHQYINIEKPLSVFADYGISEEQLANDLVYAATGERDISNVSDYFDNNEEFLSAIQQNFDNELAGLKDELAKPESIKRIKELGYDGLILPMTKTDQATIKGTGNEYITFDSNQIKNTDNTTPTSNQDIRYSLTDSQGRELSEQQQEFFKDSKVRDDEGNLLTVYHGTNADFNIFDKAKIGANTNNEGIFGKGFYFTENQDLAKGYNRKDGKVAKDGSGRTMELYLDMKKPFYWNEINTQEKMQQFIEETGMPKYVLQWNNTLKDQMRPITDIKAERKFTEVLQKNGYDGVIYKYDNTTGEYVIFDSKQAKYVDNTNPTSNPDIRYSLSEDAETFKTPYGVEVVKNPSNDDYIQMRQDILEEYPWLRGEKILRQTYDEEGNVYYWSAYDAQHADVEPYINKKYNTRTFQNDGWWKNPIYKDSPKDYSYVDTSNFKYSLSDTDSQGKKLTQGQKDFFKDVSPEVKDENNQLMRFYHGSNSEFTIFDLTKGSQSNSNAGVGFWFTPSMEGARNFANSVWYGDKTPTTFEVYLNMKNPKVYETYDNTEIRSNLKEQLDNTYKERKALTDKYSWETPSLTNLVSYMNYMDDAKLVENLKNNFKFKEENAKQYVEDAKKYIELNNQYKNIEKQFDDARWTDAYEQFRTDIYKIAGKSADDANTGGTGMALDNKEQVLKDYVNSLKEQGYDGIVIKNTVYDSNTMGGTNNQYVVFDPNQIKNITNENPTENDDIRYQLGNNEVAPIGNGIRSEQIKPQDIQNAIAPLQEQVQQLTDTITRLEDRIAPLNEQEADELYQETQRGFENEVAPIRENLTPEENQRMDMLELLERNGMLTDERRYEKEQLENKVNPVYPTEESTPGQALSDIRDMDEIGKRDVKAYQYEHPEVKPYFQEEARGMLNDLNNSIKGERFINESQQRGQGTSYDVIGVKRFTSPEIAELLDSKYGYTYDDIRKGLNAIIEDHGAENIAIAKRIELVLDDNLRNGYTDWQTGMEVPPNQQYLNMLAEQEWQNYFDDINSQYPLEQLQEPQYNLEDEETDFSDVSIEPDLSNFTADDIDVSPFLEGLQGASERQAKRQQQREELNQKKEVKIPKQSDGRRAVNRAKGLLVNEFAVLDDYSKQTGNKDIKFKTDTYNNYQAIAQSNIETAQTDINGKAIGPAGISTFEEAKRLGLSDIYDKYLKLWANVDKGKQGKGTVEYTPKEAYMEVKKIEAKYPVLKKLGKTHWQYFRNARHNLVEAGVISKELSDLLGRMYAHYTPYISENADNYFTKTGELKPKATIKRAKGGAIMDELLSAEEAMKIYTKSEFNTIFGNDLFREIVNTSNDIVQLGGDDRGMQFVNADNLYADKDGYYLTAYENGEPITARISEDMYRTLTRESRNRISDIENTFSAVTKPLQAASKLRRNILTSWSPTFIAKNFIKDFQEGIFNSKYTKDFIKNYPSAFKELATNTELAQQFKSLYGSGLTMGQYDIDANNYNPSGKNKNFLKGIKNVNELIELAPRFAEFKASIDHGASIQEAMYNAREVTTNFSRGGTLAKALNRNGFTFLNSSIQGFDKFIRNFSGENGAKGIVNSLAKAAIFGIAPAVFNELAFGSGDDKDEEYEALPDYIKDNYYIIKVGNGNFIRIPKGRVLSVFGSAARRTIEAMEGEENAFEGYFNNVQQQIGINNPEENNIFAPLIQAMGGRKLDSGQTAGSAWYGGDIIPSRLQKERPEDQYDASIDKLSIWLGQHTGISPYKINYVLDQYSGGMGDIFLPTITPEANSDGSIIAPIKDQFTADTVTDNKYVSEFYDTYNKIYTGSKKTDEDILKKNYMSNISYQMSDLYKERREIQSDTTLSKKEKYEKAQAIKAEINRLAKEGLDNYENISITGDYADINGQEYQKTDDGWKKLSSNTSDEVNSLGLTNREKNNYIKTQKDISNIKKKYKDTDDYVGKKQDIIGDIINTNLNDEAKMSLYQDTYKDKFSNYATDLGFDADTYLEYKAQDFSADKDKNGKSISGSKKQKVFDYINSMDVPYEQKLLLAKSEYNSFNDNNYEIIEYIENTGMDYDERIELYKALGFKVDGDSISW